MDTIKGIEAESDVRCRLVARDFKQKRDQGREDLYAETPPLEAIRVQLSKDYRCAGINFFARPLRSLRASKLGNGRRGVTRLWPFRLRLLCCLVIAPRRGFA